MYDGPLAGRRHRYLAPPRFPGYGWHDEDVEFHHADHRERPEVIRRMREWLKASQHDGEHEVDVLGRTFVVLSGVFSPRYYPETAFYARHILETVHPRVRFLDLGCGVGVNAVMAAERGARVVALDVNQRAVENTRRNAARHGVTVDVRQSDVFSALREGETFDVVYWNIPFTYRDPGVVLSSLEEAVFDPGYRKNLTFFEEVRIRLAPDGLVLVGVSSTLGELDTILAAGAAAGLNLEVRAWTFEDGTVPPTRLELLAARPS